MTDTMTELDSMYRCRACLQKFGGHYSSDCSHCPTDEELHGKAREELPGQVSMFDALSEEEEA